MFEREYTLYQFMLGYCSLLVADIDEAKMLHPAAPGTNPPLWILAHLAIATDYAGRLLGLPAACPKEWHASFAPGSKPPGDDCPKPSKAELMQALAAGHERVAAAVMKASTEDLNKPHETEILKRTPLKTVGDVLGHLMTTHEAGHIGQLSMWRRIMGYPPIV